MTTLPRFDRALFACDLHLPREHRTEDHASFEALLDGLPGPPLGLFLLGDLFEFWVGPEDVRLPSYAPILAALRRAADRGATVELLVGNRDFLIGGELERFCRIRVRQGPIAIRLGGAAAFLCHGDRFCLGDRGYQRMAGVLRSATVRGIWLALPARIRGRIARRFRSRAAAALSTKPAPYIDPVWSEIVRVFSAGYDIVLAGHTHRMGERSAEIGGKVRRFLTVGAWPECLMWDGGGFAPGRAR